MKKFYVKIIQFMFASLHLSVDTPRGFLCEQRKRMAWYDRHQRVAVCYNGLLFVALGLLAFNWLNFGCDIQV